MSLVLDAGAWIALDRHDRAMWRRLKVAQMAGEIPRSHGGVIGQVWRGRGARHALLAQALAGAEVRPLDQRLGRAAGELLAVTRGRDVIDAALVLLADDGDQIVTSDPDDIARLAAASGRHLEVVRA
ncbi:MAG: twitching motility protein PilT [Vicinamibacterales bacterium]